ncbi:MAG: sugar transferase [Desulfobaccales bacterium]
MQRGIPRFVEIILALGGLIIGSPWLFLAAVIIRSTSPGPVLFRQQRVGRFGKSFELVKFRSMRIENEEPQITAKNDVRVTRVGRLLRKSKLDELPELWNVVRGDLALVGPRPEVPKYVNLEDPLWHKVLEVRPGITDPVTVRLRNEEELLLRCGGDPEIFYVNTLQPYKLVGYLDYLQQRTWRTDVRVLLGTVFAIILPVKAKPPEMVEIVVHATKAYPVSEGPGL